MNEDIRQGIKIRKRLNRQYRDPRAEDREEVWEQYQSQKEEVKNMIRREMKKHEEKIAEEIKQNDRCREMWKNLNKLRGIEKTKQELAVYSEEGKRLDGGELEGEIEKTWRNIYQMHPNRMNESWNADIRRNYKEMMIVKEDELRNREVMALPRVTLDPYRWIQVMKVSIDEDDVRKIISKLKMRKATGNDELKAEQYKDLMKNKDGVRVITECLRKVLKEENEPNCWKTSRTALVPKKRCPEASELRPIAMTDISYKIMMSILAKKLENHLTDNNMRYFEQTGFTKGAGTLDNLKVLRECVEQSL